MKKSISNLLILFVFLFISFTGVSSLEAYQYQITDALMGDDISDINTTFWGWYDGTPSYWPSNATYSIDSNGFALRNCYSYLGAGDGGKWAVQGDFSLSIYISSASNTRSHFTLNEYSSPSLESETITGQFGYFGGGGVWGLNDYYTNDGGNYYFLFKKEGNQFTVYRGDENSVDETSQIVKSASVEMDNYWQIYAGINDYGKSILLRDFSLAADNLISLNGSSIPTDWGTQPIPEPATMLLLGSGLVGLAGFRRKSKK